jgi:hypothetical protein
VANSERRSADILHAHEVPTYVFPDSVVATADPVGYACGRDAAAVGRCDIGTSDGSMLACAAVTLEGRLK